LAVPLSHHVCRLSLHLHPLHRPRLDLCPLTSIRTDQLPSRHLHSFLYPFHPRMSPAPRLFRPHLLLPLVVIMRHASRNSLVSSALIRCPYLYTPDIEASFEDTYRCRSNCRMLCNSSLAPECLHNSSSQYMHIYDPYFHGDIFGQAPGEYRRMPLCSSGLLPTSRSPNIPGVEM
jgi:hypothetical protein